MRNKHQFFTPVKYCDTLVRGEKKIAVHLLFNGANRKSRRAKVSKKGFGFCHHISRDLTRKHPKTGADMGQLREVILHATKGYRIRTAD